MLCNLSKSYGVCPLHVMMIMKTDAEVRRLPPIGRHRDEKINAPLNRTILSFWLLLSDCDSGDGSARHPVPHCATEEIHFIFFHTVYSSLVNMPSKRKKNKRRMRRVVSTFTSTLIFFFLWRLSVLQTSIYVYSVQTDLYLFSFLLWSASFTWALFDLYERLFPIMLFIYYYCESITPAQLH